MNPLDAPALRRAAFALAVARGLDATPRHLACRWLYDAEGSALFEEITRLPEYYLTRAEDALLRAHAARLRRHVGPATLVELGAGSAAKTRHLLRAWLAADGRARYVPVDISAEHLDVSAGALRAELPGVDVAPRPATYEQALAALGAERPCLLLFLGSSLGNFDGDELDDFFARVARGLAPGDHLLLGIDLVKDPAVLEAAYDDAAGVTARFTRNLFARMNRELGTRLALDAIAHVSHYDVARERIEIHARLLREQVVALPLLGRRFRLARGEQILVEVSRKFRVDTLAALAGRHGFDAADAVDDGAFALVLLRRRDDPPPPAAHLVAERALTTTRAHTLALVAPLDDARLTRQVTPILSPIVWDLGHVACFESQWMRTAWGWDDWPVGTDVESLYDPIVQPRTVRGALPLPRPDDARATLAGVRERTLALLRRDGCASDDPLRAGALVPLMIARHEAQHAETMLQAIQLLHDDARYEPAGREPPRRAPVPRPGGMALVPAGPFRMGTDEPVRAYDNERPAHDVDVAAFRLDVHPVTNAAFLDFVDDGGYARRELWTEDGWRWLATARVAHPQQWRRAPDGRWHELHFGRSAPIAPDQPVVHVSWYEADAYARWAGKRLPTEAEWEKAAAWDLETGLARPFPWGDAPWTPERATLGQRTFAPSAAGAHPSGASFYGCEQMVGDVWEWTASEFLPYPGFAAFPYPEYSAVHFGRGYKVLRGGSWATQPLVVSTTFRNWDLPERRQIFAGFRCACDP